MSRLDEFHNSGNLKLHPLDHLIPVQSLLHHLFQPLHRLMWIYLIILQYHHMLLQRTLLLPQDLLARLEMQVAVVVVLDGVWDWILRMKWIQRLLLLLLNYN